MALLKAVRLSIRVFCEDEITIEEIAQWIAKAGHYRCGISQVKVWVVNKRLFEMYALIENTQTDAEVAKDMDIACIEYCDFDSADVRVIESYGNLITNKGNLIDA